MKRHMTLGDFLVAYLQKIGVRQVFGIPGDLALKLFFALGKRHGLDVLTFSHEPGVGFAADGYARATGKIGVICVTYGAGGHNMVNPVAGSFSERVPLLIFSGGPGRKNANSGHLSTIRRTRSNRSTGFIAKSLVPPRYSPIRAPRRATCMKWRRRSGPSSAPVMSRFIATWSTVRSTFPPT